MSKRGGLHTRERLLALFAGVIIAGALLFFWIVAPLSKKIENAKADLEGKEAKLESMKRLLSRSASIDKSHEALRDFFPPDAEADTLTVLDELQLMASKLSLQLNLKPRGLRSENKVQYFEVELEVQGRQEPVLSFIDSLMRLPTVFLIDRLRVNNAPTRDHQLKGSILLRQVLVGA